jgi:phage repressor protein C with HTH and peptisase S24 domain/lambda repressor-like predicted transcriptional regulator
MHPSDISSALKKIGISQAELAKRLGVSKSSVNGVINGTSRSRPIADAISKETRIPLHDLWPDFYGPDLVEGIVSQIRGPNGMGMIEHLTKDVRESNETNELQHNPEDWAYVARYRTRFAAGSGAAADETQSEYLSYRKSYLAYIGVNARTAVCVRVKGDSMEPYLFSGDTILVDTADVTIYRPKLETVLRRAYAFEQDDALRCKIIELDAEPGMLLVSSLAEGYKQERVPAHSVRIIGRVRQSARTWF